MDHSAELLQRKTAGDVERALELIAEALKISPFSEKLLEMKAESLFLVCASLLINVVPFKPLLFKVFGWLWVNFCDI